MVWSFATINNRPGEIYFDISKNRTMKIKGHDYVNREDFKIKAELRAFDQETKKFKITYRNKKYKIIKN